MSRNDSDFWVEKAPDLLKSNITYIERTTVYETKNKRNDTTAEMDEIYRANSNEIEVFDDSDEELNRGSLIRDTTRTVSLSNPIQTRDLKANDLHMEYIEK